ncbi:MAG TPA: CopG family transcriptional regulator [Thermoanaerobaculia bacterium]
MTIYLPEKLKRQLKRVAVRTKRSQAEIIREAIEAAFRQQIPPAPRIPLFDKGLGDATIAERVDELLWNDRKR